MGTLPSPQRLYPLHGQNGQGLGRSQDWSSPTVEAAPGPILTLLSLVRPFQSSEKGGCSRIILTETRPLGVAEVA